MFHNRISRYYDDSFASSWNGSPQVKPAAVSMVLLPVAILHGAWQAQLYKLAHQQAVEDGERARRFFSSLN